MNFNQWRNYAAKSDVSKVTFICGDQPALVEIVLDDIKSILKVPATDYTVIAQSAHAKLWDLASQFSLDPNANRLVVVRQAESFLYWDGLHDWLSTSRNNPKNYIVFISSQSDAPSIFDKGKRVGYYSYIDTIRSKGKLVKCSQPNEEDLKSWAMSYGLSANSAAFLVSRCSGDVAAMLDVLKKVKVWPASPDVNAVALLCDEHVTESFWDLLILGKKQDALIAASYLDSAQYGSVLLRLNSRLDMLMELHGCVSKRMYDADIVQAIGLKIFLVKKFKSVASDYTFDKIRQRRQLLAVFDGHVQAGATDKILESLVALW